MSAASTAVADGPASDVPAALGGIFRDITRGGLAGVVVGLIGCGIGGRIVMRLAAVLVPMSDGAHTENGNVIGDITLGGSLALVVFGLIVGLVAATIWVAVAPWIPGRGVARAVAAMPVAVALGGSGLIDGDNRDFSILGHDPAVVGILVLLVALIGFMFPLVDDALDRWLPAAMGRAKTLYTVAASIGIGFALLVATAFLTAPEPATVLTGVALIGLALATLRTWVLRVKSEPASSRLLIAGRGALVVAIALGFIRLASDLTRALGDAAI
jgi:hypothetical protein